MKNKKKNILIVLPIAQDRLVLSDLEQEYSFHWMDDPKFTYRQPNPYTPDLDFDLVDYTERCSTYIRENAIEGILYAHDLASMVAGVLCERHQLPGPTLEATFLASHKYYSRCQTDTTLWFDSIDLETGQWGKGEPQFPLFLKPTNLMSSMLQFRIESQEELDVALAKIRPELAPWHTMFAPFFAKYIDLNKYPLAVKNILVAEELVEQAKEYIIEGWTDSLGQSTIWAITDTYYFQDAPQTVEAYISPSCLPADTQSLLCDFALKTVEEHRLREGCWNVEIWLRDGECILTEINGRAASVWEQFQKGVYGKSIYKAMLHLSVGDSEACQEETPKIDPTQQIFGGQFHLNTFGEGIASDFLDYPLANALEDGDMEFCADEQLTIRQLRTRGFRLAMFYLFDSDEKVLATKARQVREHLLKQPELSPAQSSYEKEVIGHLS